MYLADMTRQQAHIRDQILPVLQPYVRRIVLFGSVARGEMRTESDIDLLVTLRPPEQRPVLGLRWFALEQELAQRLRRPVEMVTEDALDAYLRPFIERDGVLLYEE